MDNDTMVLIAYFVAMLLVLAMSLGAMVYSDRKNNEIRLRAIEAMEKLAHEKKQEMRAMSEPTITIPLALAQRLSDLLGGKWTYDSYGDCRYCGDPLSSEHRCELAQIERELDDLLSRAQPAPGAEALLSAAKIALDEMRHTIAPRDSFTDAVDALDAAIAAHSASNAPHQTGESE